MFVAVSNDGTGNRVMTSPDGITWTIRTSAANSWTSVTYGNGLFVAVAIDGTGNRVMTSPDGTNWTIRNSVADNSWVGIGYGNGMFVAVSTTGTGNRVMTSGKAELISAPTNNTYQGGMRVNGTSVFNSASNSTSSFQVQNAAGTAVLNVDTTNARIGIGTATPTAALEVVGDIVSKGTQ